MENSTLNPEFPPKTSSPSSKPGRGEIHPSRFIWYPFLFAAFPVLYLLASNIGEARPLAGVRPLLVALFIAAILLGLFRLLLGDRYRAAFVSAAWILVFAMYGHVYGYLREIQSPLANTAILVGVSILLAGLALFFASRPGVRFEAWVGPLNTVAWALVAVSAVQVIWSQVEMLSLPKAEEPAPIVAEQGLRPDIYYIILDSYTRSDTMMQAYRYDNSGFVRGLEGMGFNVAECAMSNYMRTELSLASSLNMNYLPELDEHITPDSMARAPLWDLIQNSQVRAYVQEQGYRTVAFSTGFPWSEWEDADVYYAPDPLDGEMTEFEGLLLDTTVFNALEAENLVDLKDVKFGRYRERTQLILDTLPTLAGMEGPKFVFAHLIIPHPPFVFAEDGSEADAVSFLNAEDKYPADKYAAGYTMQVTFIDQEMTRIVREILANSETPPVIIIQGDHGPWLLSKDRRLTILNAYYLPGHAGAVQEYTSPVNTFRLVFNLYLGGKFPLLPNVSYFSPVPNQYDFEAVTNRCRVER